MRVITTIASTLRCAFLSRRETLTIIFKTVGLLTRAASLLLLRFQTEPRVLNRLANLSSKRVFLFYNLLRLMGV